MRPELVSDPAVRSELTAGLLKLCHALVFYARLSDTRGQASQEDDERHADAVETASKVLALARTSQEARPE